MPGATRSGSTGPTTTANAAAAADAPQGSVGAAARSVASPPANDVRRSRRSVATTNAANGHVLGPTTRTRRTPASEVGSITTANAATTAAMIQPKHERDVDGAAVVTRARASPKQHHGRRRPNDSPDVELDHENAAGQADDVETERAQKKQATEEAWVRRWNDEFYEIVEQLPLELHRSFTLIRELENKNQTRLSTITRHTIAYRDARLALQRLAGLPPPEVWDSEGEIIQAPDAVRPPDAGDDAAPSLRPRTKSERLALLRSVSRCSRDAVRACEEKVGLAVSAYNWVDRHIRRLDADLLRSESSLLLGLREGTEASRGVREALRLADAKAGAEVGGGAGEVGARGATAGRADASLVADAGGEWEDASSRGAAASSARTSPLVEMRAADATSRLTPATAAALGSAPALATAAATRGGRGGRGGGRGRGRAPSRRGGGRGARSTSRGGLTPDVVAQTAARMDERGVAATDVLTPAMLVPDMAIDPNEPTYCYCDQVSFGDMVACDNDDCPREWFHYKCVGLTAPPRGKWFCLFCTPARSVPSASTTAAGAAGTSGARPLASARGVDPRLPCVPDWYRRAVAAAAVADAGADAHEGQDEAAGPVTTARARRRSGSGAASGAATSAVAASSVAEVGRGARGRGRGRGRGFRGRGRGRGGRGLLGGRGRGRGARAGP